MLRKLLIVAAMVSVVMVAFASIALGDNPPGPPGQPSQSCQAQTSTPGGGNSASSPGSPFQGGVADSHYAGTQPQNSTNPKSVSQYDVACFQVSH